MRVVAKNEMYHGGYREKGSRKGAKERKDRKEKDLTAKGAMETQRPQGKRVPLCALCGFPL
jgi:hypothetical protein